MAKMDKMGYIEENKNLKRETRLLFDLLAIKTEHCNKLEGEILDWIKEKRDYLIALQNKKIEGPYVPWDEHLRVLDLLKEKGGKP